MNFPPHSYLWQVSDGDIAITTLSRPKGIVPSNRDLWDYNTMWSKSNPQSFFNYWIKSIALSLVFCSLSLFSVESNPLNNINGTVSNEIDKRIGPDCLDEALLEAAIVQYTNLERTKHHLKTLTVSSTLQKAAAGHSREMTSLHYFSHQSPVYKNQNLTDRLKNAGFHLVNSTVGENIGVDYFLRIANIPFYTATIDGKTRYMNAKTGKPITCQTYNEFAERMVQNWMKSSGHKENILNPKYEKIGCGIASGIYQGMKAIYVTQNFSGSL